MGGRVVRGAAVVARHEVIETTKRLELHPAGTATQKHNISLAEAAGKPTGEDIHFMHWQSIN